MIHCVGKCPLDLTRGVIHCVGMPFLGCDTVGDLPYGDATPRTGLWVFHRTGILPFFCLQWVIHWPLGQVTWLELFY